MKGIIKNFLLWRLNKVAPEDYVKFAFIPEEDRIVYNLNIDAYHEDEERRNRFNEDERMDEKAHETFMRDKAEDWGIDY